MAVRSLLVVLFALASACLWRGYDDVIQVHLDVLSAEAAKAAGNAQDGVRPTSSDVTELTYPLQRARQFAYQYRSDADRASYRLFVAALDRYQRFSDAIDAARGDPARWAAAQPDLAAQYEQWRTAAAAVHAALSRET